MAVHLGKLEHFYLLTRVCEASPADITPVEVDPLLFGCEYMTQGKRTLTENCKGISGDGQRQPNECGLFTLVCPRQNQVLEWPLRYLIHRIFRVLVVLLK